MTSSTYKPAIKKKHTHTPPIYKWAIKKKYTQPKDKWAIKNTPSTNGRTIKKYIYTSPTYIETSYEKNIHLLTSLFPESFVSDVPKVYAVAGYDVQCPHNQQDTLQSKEKLIIIIYARQIYSNSKLYMYRYLMIVIIWYI